MNNNQFKMRLSLSDGSKKILDKASKGKDVSKLVVKIEATHSGVVNKNKWFYTPAGMKDGTSSFVEPFNKPILKNHNPEGDSLGRIISSEYISYTDTVDAGLVDSLDSSSYFSNIKDFIKGDLFNQDGYKGLGHIELIAEITDKDAIEKLLDNRFLTVSISGDTDQAICSICGQDAKSLNDGEEPCSHYRGEIYDGEEAFLIAGAMTFDEASFVNKPADEHAKVELLKDNISLEDNTQFQDMIIIDFETDDKTTGDNKLKIKLSDLIKKDDLQEILNEELKNLNLGDYIPSEEDLGKLRKTSFLFSDERVIPIHSKADIIAAQKVIGDRIEDSKDKKDLMTILDTKFKKAFGDMSFEDAVSSLEKPNEDKNVEIPAQVDYELISDKVVEKLKGLFDLDSSFLAKRNDNLEDEISSLEAENISLSDSLKTNIVLQILQIQDDATNSDLKDKLSARSLDSLKDKLSDLLEDSAETESNEEVIDPNVDISDSEDDNGTNTNSEDESDLGNENKDSGDALTVGQIRDEYKNLIKTKGLTAASGYLSNLRKEDKLPANFTFQNNK